MPHSHRPSPPAATRPLALAAAFWAACGLAHAQPAAPTEPAAATVEAAAPSGRADIGQATDRLLTLQRGAQGRYPRDIDGEQASRSYQRYLKSFETEIPASYETGINTGTDN